MFSEVGVDGRSYISSKRVIGTILILIVMICTIWLVHTEGGTDVVENLLQTAMIIAASLLGISSVTGIWKGNSFKVADDTKNDTDTHKEHIEKLNRKKFKCPYMEQEEKDR